MIKRRLFAFNIISITTDTKTESKYIYIHVYFLNLLDIQSV